MRVKICGIRTTADAVAAVEAGADAIGLNFYAGPRRIDLTTGAEILESLPPLICPVALVKMEQGMMAYDLACLLTRFQVSLVQVYGQISCECMIRLRSAGFSAVPAVAVRDAGFADQRPVWQSGESQWRPRAIILDTYDPARAGGTGKAFRWDWVREARDQGRLAGWPPIILAGGLNPDNVAEAIRVARPYAVDVSSGVEIEGSPGRKDPDRMRMFVRSAKAAFERNTE